MTLATCINVGTKQRVLPTFAHTCRRCAYTTGMPLVLQRRQRPGMPFPDQVLCSLSSPDFRLGSLTADPCASQNSPQNRLAQKSRTLTQDPAVSTFGDMTVRENCQLARTDGMDRSRLAKLFAADFHPQLPNKNRLLPTRTLSGVAAMLSAGGWAQKLRPFWHTAVARRAPQCRGPHGLINRAMRATAACAEQLPHEAVVMTTHRLEDALRAVTDSRCCAFFRASIPPYASGGSTNAD